MLDLVGGRTAAFEVIRLANDKELEAEAIMRRAGYRWRLPGCRWAWSIRIGPPMTFEVSGTARRGSRSYARPPRHSRSSSGTPRRRTGTSRGYSRKPATACAACRPPERRTRDTRRCCRRRQGCRRRVTVRAADGVDRSLHPAHLHRPFLQTGQNQSRRAPPIRARALERAAVPGELRADVRYATAARDLEKEHALVQEWFDRVRKYKA